jgi:hypothetical protein
MSETPSRIVLSAYEAAPHGIQRLARVVAGCPSTTLELMQGLHDHKGTLTIDWRSLPSSSHRGIMVDLWAEQCEYCWEHLVDGRSCPEHAWGGLQAA